MVFARCCNVWSTWVKSWCFATTQTAADVAATVAAIATAVSSVSLRRKLMPEGSRLFAEGVPDPANRLQEAGLTALFELAAEGADVHPERIRRRSEVVAPNTLVDLRARQHLARVAQEELEQVELGARQLQAALAARCFAGRRVERDVGELKDAVAH